MEQIPIAIEEFYQIVGELEVLRRKHIFQLQSLFNQVNEMQAEIERLRNENGRLVEANYNVELRDLRGRGQEP